MSDVFLSYKQTDRARVAPLAEALEAEGFTVWWDAAIPLGQTYYSAIETQLTAAKVVIPVWSEDSITSEWVREEATKGKHQGKLLPVKIDAVEPPVGFSTIQTADLSNWTGDRDAPEWRTVVAHIKQLGAALGPVQTVKKAKAKTTGFGGAAPEEGTKKKGAAKPLLIAAGLAVLGLIVLSAVANQPAPASGPTPLNPGPAPANPQIQAAENAAYQAAVQVRNRSAYEAFLKLYPQSSFAGDVSQRLASCRTEQQSSAASMPVTATGWANYVNGGCNTAQSVANSYLQQGCLNYSTAGLVTNPQYVPSQSMDATGNPICIVQAQAVCTFPQATAAAYEVCQ
jgi:hypothetical protein